VDRYGAWPLDVAIVSYGRPNPALQPLLARFA
jgi:hypothetical protein